MKIYLGGVVFNGDNHSGNFDTWEWLKKKYLHLCSNDILRFQEHGDSSPLRDY